MNWKQQIHKEMLKALQQQQEANGKSIITGWSQLFDKQPIAYDFGPNQEPKPRLTSTEPSARLTELVGWRQWRLDDGKLWSLFANCCWAGPTLSAEKPALDGEERLSTALFSQSLFQRDPDPFIGIMAYKKASSLCTPRSWLALGSVYLWGSIAEHTDGYRAERATIRSLLVHPDAAGQIEALQTRYQPESIGIYRNFAEQLEAL